MASNPTEPRPPQPSGLQSMLARLRGMVQALKSTEMPSGPAEEIMPGWDVSAAAPSPPPVAEALPVAELAADTASQEPAPSVAAPGVECAPAAVETGAAAPAQEPPAPPQLCPYCQAPRSGDQEYCDNCGWVFPPPSATPETAAPLATAATARLWERYELGIKLGGRGDLVRYRGLDYGRGGLEPVPVVLVQTPLPAASEAVALDEIAVEVPADRVASADTAVVAEGEIPTVDFVPAHANWPSLTWERSLLEQSAHPSLPHVLDQFTEGGFEYLVEELPTGLLLWDAWEDPQAVAEQRFGWLKQIAEALQHLHQHGAILEGLRPDIVVVEAGSQARLTDLSDLLPLPLPANPPIRATHYTAPELVLSSEQADARADLYSFGAMLYALHLGRELTELDFELQGVPKSFIGRFPDIHPLFGRLVSKTFCREPERRFPTEDAALTDPTGFTELIRTLETCQRTFDHVRLEIAAWTTTGMVRSGNEDAFALLHAAESREDELGDAALLLLADGMGGSEAGEIAAALAIRVMRQFLVQRAPFTALAGASAFAEGSAPDSVPASLDIVECQKFMKEALLEANKQVYEASHDGRGRHGMGCTAEVVYLNGRHLLVGHVGDSRTYHLHLGNLVQVTRDQTWVNRMMELGVLSAAEAEEHPRRSELQQAIGGHAEVEPETYAATLKPGDWVVVCSDGLSNHLSLANLRDLLQTSTSAESAARRLVNQVNLAGALDNATVVIVRVT
jgi:serine/threonine protein phosphatase PrpC